MNKEELERFIQFILADIFYNKTLDTINIRTNLHNLVKATMIYCKCNFDETPITDDDVKFLAYIRYIIGVNKL
jgi:hypothetical protein